MVLSLLRSNIYTLTQFFHYFQFEGMRRNFISYRYGPINTLDEPYDFLSIMHYDNKAFTKNGKDTLQSLTNPKMKLGQMKRLTKTDVNQINKLYRCSKRVRKGMNIIYMLHMNMKLKVSVSDVTLVGQGR